MQRVAIGFFHLLVVNIADSLLRLGSLFHRRIEQNKILVLRFRLRQAMGAALAIPAVGDCQLGLRQVFARIVGIDQRLQSQPRDFKTAVLDIVNRPVE